MIRVAIVGAGLLGSAVAYQLACRGATVTVLETDRPAAGTSGATFAWLNAQDKAPADYFALNVAGIAEYASLTPALGTDWHHPGGDLVLGRGAAIETLRERIARHEAQGYPVRTLDRAELAALEPGLDPGDDGLLVAHFHGEAWIDPPLLIGRLLEAAGAAGAHVRSGVTVEGFEVSGGHVTGTRLAGGERLAAEAVVLAAGPANERLAATVGVRLPMAPSPGLLALTEPVAVGLGHVVHAGDVAFRPDGGGRLMLSSRSIDAALEPATRELAPDAEPVAEVLARAARVVPALRRRAGRARAGRGQIGPGGRSAGGRLRARDREPVPAREPQRSDARGAPRPARRVGAARPDRGAARAVSADALPGGGLTDDGASGASGRPRIAEYERLYLDGIIDGVALVAFDANACPACLAVSDRSYLPSGLPALPIADCTSPTGCRCRYEPNVTVYE